MKKREYILYLFGGLLLIALFTSICSPNKFFLLNGGSLLYVMLCLLPINISLILMINGIRKKGKCKLHISITDILIFVYSIYVLLNIYEGYSAAKILEYIFLILLYIYFRNLKPLISSFLFLMIAVLGIWQILAGFRNLIYNEGMYYNTGIFGCFLAISSILSVGAAVYFYKIKQKSVFCVGIVLILLIIVQLVVLRSRTAWLSSFMGFAVLIIAENSRYKKKCFSKSRLSNVMTIILFMLFLVFSAKALYTYKKDSADGRLLIWTTSYSIFKQNPLIGNGTGSFSALYMDAQALYFKDYPESKYSMLAGEMASPCNEYIRIVVEEGLIGLLLIIAIISFLLFRSKLQSEGISILNIATFNTIKAAFIGLLVVAFFTSALDLYQFKALCVIFVAFLSSYVRPVYLVHLPFGYERTSNVCLMIGFIILSFYAIEQAKSYYDAVRKWYSVETSHIDDCNEKIKLYANIYPALKADAFFLYNYACILRTKDDFNKAAVLLEQAVKIRSSYYLNIELGEVYAKQENYQAAMECWNIAADMIPSRFLPLYLMITLENKLGQKEKARLDAINFIRKEVKVENPEIDFMKYEINRLFNLKIY